MLGMAIYLEINIIFQGHLIELVQKIKTEKTNCCDVMLALMLCDIITSYTPSVLKTLDA
jgi:hypothetical protein